VTAVFRSILKTLNACIVKKRSDMDHTVLPPIYTMPAFPS